MTCVAATRLRRKAKGGYLRVVPATQTRTLNIGQNMHRIEARWQWPAASAVSVRLGDQELATVEYFPASASAHWILHWIGDDFGSEGPGQLPLIGLAGIVPEEVDADPALQAAVLELALDAAAERLSGKPARIEPSDA
jgi:hypothetical protein